MWHRHPPVSCCASGREWFGGDDQVGLVTALLGEERRRTRDEGEDRGAAPAERGGRGGALRYRRTRGDAVDSRLGVGASHLDRVSRLHVVERRELAEGP